MNKSRRFLFLAALIFLIRAPEALAERLTRSGRVVATAGLGYGLSDASLGRNQNMGFALEAAWLFRLGEGPLMIGPRAEFAAYSTVHEDGKVTQGTFDFGGGVQIQYNTEPSPFALLDTDAHMGAYVFVLGGGGDLTFYDKRGVTEVKNTLNGGALSLGGGINWFFGKELYTVAGLSAAYSRIYGSPDAHSVRTLAQLGFAFD